MGEQPFSNEELGFMFFVGSVYFRVYKKSRGIRKYMA